MSALKQNIRSKNTDLTSIRADLGILQTQVETITPINLEAVPLVEINNIPNDIVPSTNLQGGYIPVFNFGGKQECQLVSLYTNGIDYNIIPKIITCPLFNGNMSVLDIVINSVDYSIKNVSLNNISNIMSTGKFNDKSFFGTFKVLSHDGPGMILVASYDEILNSNSILYEITNLNEVSKGTITHKNSFEIGKEYDFELMTNSYLRRIYIKENSSSDWSNSYLFEDNLDADVSHPVASFGFLLNPNVSMRNLRCDSALYNKRKSFSNLAPLVDQIVNKDIDNISVAFEPYELSEKIELFQLPKDGTWNNAPNELWVNLTYEQPGFHNIYKIDIFSENVYSGFNNNNDKKLIGLLPNNEIPDVVINSLSSIKNSTDVPLEQEYIQNILDGYFFEDIIYIEEVSSTSNNTIIIWLFNVNTLILLRLLYTFESHTFEYDALLLRGEPSQIKNNSNSADTIEKLHVYGTNRFKQLSVGLVNTVNSFSEFYS